jgi:hypothetical protein
MTAPTPTRCPACGAAVTGRFCGDCGAPAAAPACASCGTALSPAARFCHRCGAARRPGIPPDRERTAWLAAAAISLVAVLFIAWKVQAGAVPVAATPDMGSAGATAGGVMRAPDISRMSPREQFDRLFDRVVGAAERERADTVALFVPMALGAYAQLDSVDHDARYHAAMIHLVAGQLAAARALADTIQADAPGHLFAAVIRGEAAQAGGDAGALATAYADFLAAWDRERARQRPEYAEHQPILEDFRTRALAHRRK